MREYGGDTHFACLEAQALAKKQYIFNVFLLRDQAKKSCYLF